MGIERIFTTKKANKLPVVVNVSTSYPNEDLITITSLQKEGLVILFQKYQKV